MFSARKCMAGLIILLLAVSPCYPAAGAGASAAPAPAGLKGVAYKYRQGVKMMPKGISYGFRELTGAKSPGARYMVLNKNTSFKPAAGDIYIDETGKTSIKVTGTGSESGGNKLIPVTRPGLADIFENFSIPRQSVIPNKMNIENISPSFNISGSDTLSIDLKSPLTVDENQTGNTSGNASPAGSSDCIGILSPGAYSDSGASSGGNPADNSGTVPYDGSGYGSSQNSGDDPGTDINSIEAASSNQNSYMEADTGADFAAEYNKASDPASSQNASGSKSTSPGITATDQSNAYLVITKASVKLGKPVINADITIDPITQHILVSMDSQIDTAVTIEGEVQLKREVQIHLYDYHLSAEKCDLYVGIYLILGVDGNAHISINLNSSGTFRNGAECGAMFGIPLDAHPIGYYQPKSVECGIEVNSDIKAWAAAAPEIGLVILGIDTLKMQLWAGLEGGSTYFTDSSSGSARNSARIRANYRTSLTGWLFGFPVRLFDMTVPLLDKNVASNSPDRLVMAETANNAAGKQMKYSQIRIDRVDAYRNVVEGSVMIDGKPYKSKSGSVKLTIYGADDSGYLDTSKIISQVNTSTGADGKFTASVPLTLDDYAYVRFDETSAGSIAWGISDYVKAASPFDMIALDADAFNDILKGTIRGKYSDPDGKPGSGDEVSYSGTVLVNVTNDEDHTSHDYATKADKGSFQAQIPIKGGDNVKVVIHPFGNNIEEISAYAEPNLNALDFRLKKSAVQTGSGKYMTIDGAIYNKAGGKPYEGEAILDWKDFDETDTQTVNVSVQYETAPGKSATASGLAASKTQKQGASPAIAITTKKTPGSTFEFSNIKDILIKSFGTKDQHIVVSISYEGIERVLGWGGKTPPAVNAPAAGKAVTNPYDDISNPVINPGDAQAPVENGIYENNGREVNIVTY